jgi:hypothetical protein
MDFESPEHATTRTRSVNTTEPPSEPLVSGSCVLTGKGGYVIDFEPIELIGRSDLEMPRASSSSPTLEYP